jgi:hypothetical protein
MYIEERARLVPGEYLFQLLDQGGRGDNDSERSKRIAGLTGPNILDQGTIKNWMKRPGDDAKHLHKECSMFNYQCLMSEQR